MSMIRKKSVILGIVCLALSIGIVISQSFAQQGKPAQGKPAMEKPKNLKVLPKNISHDDLMDVMRNFSRSLGVRCGYCHETTQPASPSNPPKMDFASDAKPEKLTTRKMMAMVGDINKKYLDKMSKGHFEQIGCVTCHMGHTKPIVSVDSLAAPAKS